MVINRLKDEKGGNMLRSLFIFSLMLFTSCIASNVDSYYSHEEIQNKAVWDKVSLSIVEIENYRFNPRLGYNILYCTGTGVIWDDDNHIITNAHVARYASSIKVVLRSGKRREAKIVGINYAEDIAILQVKTFPLVDGILIPIQKGDSDKLFVGQTVFSLGYPYGMPLSMSGGIISGLCRGIDGRDDIQTDASINPGNSGGALINSRGALIGMPSYIRTRGGGSEGCNFAIPVNRIKNVVEILLKEAKNPSLISQKLFFNFL